MTITIDTREDLETIANILKQFGEEVLFSFELLKHGDFILNNSVIFERKTLKDFILSIKDGRIFRQTYRIADTKIPYILILEGDKNSVEGTGMRRKAIQGVMVHLSVFMGIPVLRSSDIYETLSLIISAGRQIEKAENPANRKVYRLNRKARKRNTDILKIQLLKNLPGVGYCKAKDLLKNFGSLRNIANLTEKELIQSKGIGKKTAKEIVKAFD